MTVYGHKKLMEELDQLTKVEREQIKKAISEARAQGDLSENAEYQFAKEKQSIIEGRILDIQGKMAKANVVDSKSIKSNKIVFGATVKLLNPETDEEITYQIVGEDEADPKLGKISHSSPLGRALIGNEEGDEISVKAPKGDIIYEIQKIRYI